jgi:hypothetical protein
MKKILTAIVMLLMLSSISFAVIRVDISETFTETDPIWNSEKANYVTSIMFNSIGNWSADKDNYFNKTETNSTGFIGLICVNGEIMKWSGSGWSCASDSGGISQIFSGNSLAYITGGDTVNVNQTALDNLYLVNQTTITGVSFSGTDGQFNRTYTGGNIKAIYVDGIRWFNNTDYIYNSTTLLFIARLWDDQEVLIET